MIRQEIINLIQKATGKPKEEIQVEKPENEVYGDYSTNIALQLKKDPAKIVKKIKPDLFEKIEVAKPGFINFFLLKEYLQKQVAEILKQGEK
ncbi:MAG: arginine--tRNA ligase, partial [Candidatus Nealsonbacteria bacterium CG10_big_fil_rev_8_21_14_0_10_37_25]